MSIEISKKNFPRKISKKNFPRKISKKNFQEKFPVFPNNSILSKKNRFFLKMAILSKKIRFYPKNSIFTKNFLFFSKNVDFFQKILSFSNNFDFFYDFLLFLKISTFSKKFRFFSIILKCSWFMQNKYFQLCLWFQRACSGKLAAVNFIVNITSVNSNKSFFLSITKDVPFIFSLFNQFIALSIDRKWVDRCIGRRHLGRNVICITRAISSKVVNCLPDIRFATFNRFFLFTIISN